MQANMNSRSRDAISSSRFALADACARASPPGSALEDAPQAAALASVGQPPNDAEQTLA